MKIKDILEGVLGSLVRGMGTAAGVPTDSISLPKRVTPSAATTSPTQPTTVQPSRKLGKRDMQVVVDKPGQPLTVMYQGQMYSNEGGLRAKWVMTKTGREVNNMFQSVLDTEWAKHVGEGN